MDLSAYEWEEWWTSDLGAVHRLTRSGEHTLFVKEAADLSAEHERFLWCAGRLPIPEIVAYLPGERDRLVTLALPGAGAHDRVAEPDTAVAALALAAALRRIHALPINDCPFVSYTPESLIETVAPSVNRAVEIWDEDQGSMRAAGAVLDELIATQPDTPELVVVHGDASTPNFVISGGELIGVVDVADLGVGDPWSDLSACLASMRRPGNGLVHEQERFLDAYGVAPDPAIARWHRLLYRLDDARH